jgi:hypothetical protein
MMGKGRYKRLGFNAFGELVDGIFVHGIAGGRSEDSVQAQWTGIRMYKLISRTYMDRPYGQHQV